MKRALAAIVVLMAGCGGQSAPAVALPVGVVDGWVYAIVGSSLLEPNDPPAPSPQPKPNPTPGNLCPNCGGTGKLPGDGRTFPTCPDCNGTGKRTAKPAPKIKPPTPATVGSCTGGSCNAPAGNTYQPRVRILRRLR